MHGHMEGKGGVYMGIVTNAADPDGRGRVRVQLPSLETGGASNWAPVCTPAGAPRGTAPSVGSMVVVAFEHGDIRRPVVLGTVQG